MPRFLVDLHIHTLLSPCGDLDMSPEVIVRRAVAAGVDAIAVCDHNTTLQTSVVCEAGRQYGLKVFRGVELTTREEVHCVAILPDAPSAERLQEWIDAHILRIPNNPDKLGDQIWVDENEMIAGEIEWYLNAPIDCSIEETSAKIAELGGLFIPAHVDRQSNGLFGQLGFLPPGLAMSAVEYNFPERFAEIKKTCPALERYACYTASDAHFPNDIGTNPSWLYAERRTFEELRKAFAGEDGRRIVSVKQEP